MTAYARSRDQALYRRGGHLAALDGPGLTLWPWQDSGRFESLSSAWHAKASADPSTAAGVRACCEVLRLHEGHSKSQLRRRSRTDDGGV